ncbi:MAG: hypothetical protein NVS2B8_02880 [Vulcanimicrobiaceae bacterium]
MSMLLRLVFVFAVAAALMAHAQLSSWNETSRMAAIESLVDRNTFIIDDSPFKTGDKYRYRGHFYSDKPPILNVAGAGVALVLGVLHVNVIRQVKIVLFAATVVTVSVPFGFAVGAVFALLRLIRVDDGWAAGVATIAATGTLAYPYATVLINHVPAAACLLWALYWIARSDRANRPAWLAYAGVLLALSIGIDSSYVIFLVLAPIAIGRAPIRGYGALIVGAAMPLIALAATDVALSGNVRPPDTNAPLFIYPGSRFAQGYIIGSLGHRSPGELAIYAFNLLAGTRGLFLYSPVLLYGCYALVRGLRASPGCNASIDWRVYAFIASSSTAYVLSTVFATSDYGGDAYGMRRFVGIAMLLCLPLGLLARNLREKRRTRTAFSIVVSASIFIALAGVNDTFSYQHFPLLDAIPAIMRYTRAFRVHGTLNLIFLAVFGVACFAFVRRSMTPQQRAPATTFTERSAS